MGSMEVCMKLVIESEATVDAALKQIKMFFDTQCADYPYLKGKMHIYVDLKNDKRQICPDNEKEYVISEEEVVDVLEQEKLDLFYKMNDKLEYDLQCLLKQRKDKEREITRDKRYLDTAEEKGRKIERIENRKIALQVHIEQLAELQNRIHEYHTVISAINDGQFECNVKIRTEKKYGRNKRTYEMILSGQSEEYQWIYSNIYGLSNLLMHQ